MAPSVFADEKNHNVSGWWLNHRTYGSKMGDDHSIWKETSSKYWIQFQCGYCPIQRNKLNKHLDTSLKKKWLTCTLPQSSTAMGNTVIPLQLEVYSCEHKARIFQDKHMSRLNSMAVWLSAWNLPMNGVFHSVVTWNFTDTIWKFNIAMEATFTYCLHGHFP